MAIVSRHIWYLERCHFFAAAIIGAQRTIFLLRYWQSTMAVICIQSASFALSLYLNGWFNKMLDSWNGCNVANAFYSKIIVFSLKLCRLQHYQRQCLPDTLTYILHKQFAIDMIVFRSFVILCTLVMCHCDALGYRVWDSKRIKVLNLSNTQCRNENQHEERQRERGTQIGKKDSIQRDATHCRDVGC